MALNIIKADDVLSKKIKTLAPTLATYFSEEKLIQMLQEGEEFAITIKAKENEMLKRAQENVEKKKKEFEQELIATKKKSHEEGLAEGKKKFQDKVESFLKEIDSIKNEAKSSLENFLEDAEIEIAKLAFSLSKKIIQTSFEKKEQIFIDFIKNIFDEINLKENICLKIHPDRYNLLLSYKEDFSSYLGIENLKIQKDSSIDVCGVGIALDSGFVDASINKIFSKIEKKLFNE
jgi:flagellar assembly protein FliH